MLTLAEAKPCPFCANRGAEDLRIKEYDSDAFCVMCDCGGEGPLGEDEHGAVACWNRRDYANITSTQQT